MARNYLNNRDMLLEIHKSKMTYCYCDDDNYYFYDLILADPPYSIEDCEHYGCCMVKRNVVFKECFKILQSGGFLIWLDQVLPNYKKSEFDIVGRIGMVKSTNHRFRVVTIFRKI